MMDEVVRELEWQQSASSFGEEDDDIGAPVIEDSSGVTDRSKKFDLEVIHEREFQHQSGEDAEDNRAIGDSSNKGDGSNNSTNEDSPAPLEVSRNSSVGPTLSDFPQGNHPKASQAPADIENRSLQEANDAEIINSQLEIMIRKSMQDLESTLNSINIGSSFRAIGDSERESMSLNSDITNTSILRQQILAADFGPQSVSSTQLQRASTGPGTYALEAVRESKLNQSASSSVEGEEFFSCSESTSSDNKDISVKATDAAQSAESPSGQQKAALAVIDDKPDKNQPISVPLSPSSAARSLHEYRALPVQPSRVPVLDQDEAIGENSSIGSSGSEDFDPYPATPSLLDSQVEVDPIKNHNRTYTLVAIIALLLKTIAVLATIAVLYSVSSSKSPRGLPAGSAPVLADSSWIRTNVATKSSATRSHLSDEALYSSFEVLVGDGIYISGSYQNLAAVWVTEQDPLRHRVAMERLEQRFLLACFYFKTTNKCLEPWLSCNYETPLPTSRSDSRLGFNCLDGDYSARLGVSRAAPAITDASPASRARRQSVCRLEIPLHDERGEITGYKVTESLQWLSGYSECNWAGITCKQDEPDGSLGANPPRNPVIDINLGKDMHKCRDVLVEFILLKLYSPSSIFLTKRVRCQYLMKHSSQNFCNFQAWSRFVTDCRNDSYFQQWMSFSLCVLYIITHQNTDKKNI